MDGYTGYLHPPNLRPASDLSSGPRADSEKVPGSRSFLTKLWVDFRSDLRELFRAACAARAAALASGAFEARWHTRAARARRMSSTAICTSEIRLALV